MSTEYVRQVRVCDGDWSLYLHCSRCCAVIEPSELVYSGMYEPAPHPSPFFLSPTPLPPYILQRIDTCACAARARAADSDKLGEGMSGVVYKSLYHGAQVAVKVIKFDP